MWGGFGPKALEGLGKLWRATSLGPVGECAEDRVLGGFGILTVDHLTQVTQTTCRLRPV